MSAAADALETTYLKRRGQTLPIVGVRKRAACLIALTATYGLRGDKSVPTVAAGVNQNRCAFLDRLWALCKHDKYFPVRGIDPDPHFFDEDRAIRAFELCARCKPTCVIYPEWMQRRLTFKSCGHANFCQACRAAVVQRQYQQYKQLINALLATDANARLFVTVHIVRRFVPLPNIKPNEHADEHTLTAAITTVANGIVHLKKHVTSRRHHSFVQRNTLASYWRIDGRPADNGCWLELRRLYVSRPGRKIPTDVPRGAQTRFKQTVLVTGGKTWSERKIDNVEDELAELMITFSEYPVELLREDLDVTAAYLNASAKQRMVGGTGKFKCAGSALVKRMRREDQNRKTNAPQKSA